MGLFDNKVVAITGAGGGIGREYALAFAAEGAKVVVNDLGSSRDGSGGGETMAGAVVKEIESNGGSALASFDSVATRQGADAIVGAALSKFGRLDIIVNNAGILRDKTLLKMDEEMFDSVIAVHLKGTWLCTQAAARAMVEQGNGGRIINTTSVAGLRGNFGQTNYAAAKAGIYGITLSAAMELGRKGITVNAIAPIAKTRMTEELEVVPTDYEAKAVAPMALYLASENACEVNGRVFGVHGNHIFEYKMTMSDGMRATSPWTVGTIAENLEVISGNAPAPTQAAAETAASAAPATDSERVADVFARMPAGFEPDKATGWKATMHFCIKGAGDFTVNVADGSAKTAPALEGTPTCVVKTDVDTFLGMVDGSVDGQQAFMQGKVTATNLGDMMKYKGAFSKKAAESRQAATAPKASGATSSASAAPATDSERVADVFARMPAGFEPDKAAGWKATMHFCIKGAGDFTVNVADGSAKTAPALEGTPTCVVKTDVDTFLGMVDGSVDGQQAFMQGKVTATNLGDMMKYKGAFSKKAAESRQAATAPKASGATPSDSAVPPIDSSTAVDVQLSSKEVIDLVFDSADQLFESVKSMTFDFGDSKMAIGVTEGSTVRTSYDTLVAALDGKLDLKEAALNLDLVATNTGDLLWFIDTLRAADYRRVIQTKAASRPINASAEYREKVFHGAPVVVSPEDAADYASATDDENPEYRRGEFPLAPPMLAVRYHHELAHRALTDAGIEVNLLRLVFGEQELRFFSPLRVGDVIAPKVQLHGIEHKTSGSVIRFRYRLMREGELIGETISSYFVRGEGGRSKSKKSATQSNWLSSPSFTREFTIRDDQSRDYAKASLDNNPIHVDEATAKAAGFPGIINHGLCTLALTGRTLVDHFGDRRPEALRHIRCRFSAPVFMGDTLRVSAETRGDDIAFEAVNQNGKTVLKDGVAGIHLEK